MLVADRSTQFLILTIERSPGYNTDWLTGLISGFVLFFVGLINMNVHYQAGYVLRETAGIEGIFVMKITDPPEIKEKSVKTTALIKDRLYHGVWVNSQQKILVYLEKDSSSVRLLPGDILLAKLRLNGVPTPQNPGAFDYSKYLAAKGIYNQAYIKSGLWKLAGKSGRKSLHVLAFKWQNKLLHTYQRIGLNNTLYSLLSALTLGYKSDLEAHTKQIFSAAGVMHVMALSGFNVAVIALVMGYLLIFTDRSRTGRIFKTSVIILVIWLFAFVTGLSPSVTRAAVMISFVMTGKLLHRQINTYNILFVSAFLILTISPALVYDISFQLSFAAVLGILIYQPVLYGLLVFKNFFNDKIWQLFTLSCAAQLSTLPLTLFYFHQFPVYFWLTNLYVVPLVSVIICVAGFYLIVAAITPFALAIGKLLAILLAALYKAVAFVEILPYSLIENIRINKIQVVLLLFFILYLGFFILQRKLKFLWVATTLFIFFQLANTVHYLKIKNQKVFMVGNIKGISAINIISDRNGMLLSDSVLSLENPLTHSAFNNFWTDQGVAKHTCFVDFNIESARLHHHIEGLCCKSPWLGNNLIFEFSGKRIIVLNDNQLYKSNAGYPLKTDLVIITGQMKPDLRAMLNVLNPELLILDSSVKGYKANKWIALCKQAGIKYWYVSQQGYYLLKIR
jgi:competence protein ComEC